MIVEQKGQYFVPVHITLQTREEYEYILNAVEFAASEAYDTDDYYVLTDLHKQLKERVK